MLMEKYSCTHKLLTWMNYLLWPFEIWNYGWSRALNNIYNILIISKMTWNYLDVALL